MKSIVTLDNYYAPEELGVEIASFVDYYTTNGTMNRGTTSPRRMSIMESQQRYYLGESESRSKP
ncbi:MAG: hypothetical protein WC674_02705 [Candidatus Krumholzibacteriia bacterium]